MLRLYLRLIFNSFEKIRDFWGQLGSLHYSIVKPVIYRKKIAKVLEINREKLSRKQEMVDIINKQYKKNMNLIR